MKQVADGWDSCCRRRCTSSSCTREAEVIKEVVNAQGCSANPRLYEEDPEGTSHCLSMDCWVCTLGMHISIRPKPLAVHLGSASPLLLSIRQQHILRSRNSRESPREQQMLPNVDSACCFLGFALLLYLTFIACCCLLKQTNSTCPFTFAECSHGKHFWTAQTHVLSIYMSIYNISTAQTHVYRMQPPPPSPPLPLQ